MVSTLRLFASGLKLAFLAGLFLAALEGSARIDDYISYRAPLLGNPSLNDLKLVEAWGIRGRPGGRFRKWRLNSLGLQGAVVSRERVPGRLRIIVLGASVCFGLYESAGMTFPEQLARIIQGAREEPVDVLNASLAGMTAPRAKELWEHYLKEFQPDILVYYPAPVTYLGDAPPSSRFVPPESQPTTGFELRSLAMLSAGLTRGLPQVIQDWRLRTGMLRALERLVKGRDESWFFSAVPEDRLDLFEKQLQALVESARSEGVQVILGTHANRFKLPLAPREELQLLSWRVFYPRAKCEVILATETSANERVRRVGRRTDTRVAEVADAVGGDPRNFDDFAHFSDRGATLAAAAFAREVFDVLAVTRATQVASQPLNHTISELQKSDAVNDRRE